MQRKKKRRKLKEDQPNLWTYRKDHKVELAMNLRQAGNFLASRLCSGDIAYPHTPS